MGDFIARILARPPVAHLVQAGQRYGERLGAQFAAGITYFSVLAIVPVLMVAFAVAGLTLTLVYPEALETLRAWIHTTVSGQGSLGEEITAVVDQAFYSWRGVGIVGLVSAAWAGVSWVNNLRSAVQAMMRPEFDVSQKRTNVVVGTLANLAILLALFVLVAVSLALTTTATAARRYVGGLFGLEQHVWGGVLLALGPLVGTLLAGFVLFAFLLRVFPEVRVPARLLLRGAAIGAVGMAALQYLTGTLVGVFAGNAAAAVFGSVIVVMLYFNLFATLILVVAAWVGTDPALQPPTGPTPGEVVPAHPTDWATKKVAAELQAARERAERDHVPTRVAVRSTRVGMGLGALFGGLVAGLAALVATVIGGLRNRG